MTLKEANGVIHNEILSKRTEQNIINDLEEIDEILNKRVVIKGENMSAEEWENYKEDTMRFIEKRDALEEELKKIDR